MRHYVLTRSAYGPGWSLEANRRRLAVTVAVTVASMAAQSWREWEWIVALDVADPLQVQRKAAFESAGVPVRYLYVSTEGEPSAAAVGLYSAPWPSLLGPRDEQVSMTRLDDDDALAPWVMARLAAVAPRMQVRTAVVFPLGLRVWRGRYTLVRHTSNAMHTLITPAGDELVVYDYPHRKVRQWARVRQGDARVAWVWSRHPETISGWRVADRALTPALCDMFPIDWSVFGSPEGPAVRAGLSFR